MLINILLEMAKHPPAQSQAPAVDTEVLQKRYLDSFEKGEQRAQAEEILDLGRVSYQLRDDDNIYLGRIEDQFQRAVNEGRKRLAKRGLQKLDTIAPEEISRALKDPSYIPQAPLRGKTARRARRFQVTRTSINWSACRTGLSQSNCPNYFKYRGFSRIQIR